MKREKAQFATEADLCAAFIAALPEGWTAYPETCGFDILLARPADGFQIGVEAKLTLNAKVIEQVTEGYWDVCRAGPDCRAVLIPYGAAGSFAGVCDLLAITVVEMLTPELMRHRYRTCMFQPDLPGVSRSSYDPRRWHEWCPTKRCELPDYVPDVAAGSSAPVRLTDWKVRAIRIAVILQKRGFVTRADFKAIGIDHRRWITPGIDWLAPSDSKGVYVAGRHLPDFAAQHPTNFEQIAADADRWMPSAPAVSAGQGVLV